MPTSIFQLAFLTILLSSALTNAQSSSSPSSVSPSSASSLSTSVTTPQISVSLYSTNPTAIPLTGIRSGESSSPTPTLQSTPASGSTPTFLPGAPPLPQLSSIKPSNYPKLDVVPPTDSQEVLQWIAEVQSTGIQIPNIPINNLGGCPNNTEAASDPSRCWWTCGGCVRKTDVSVCPTVNTWGLTYDDGPAYYTPNLLSFLDQNSLKSTFFVIGSRAVSFPAILQAEYIGQHHISVHTWSHSAPLTTLTNEQIIAELGWSKKIIRDVLGVTPNTMRPPFGDIDDRVRAISLAMGLTPIMWTRISATATFDTADYYIAGGTVTSSQVIQNWEYIMGNVSTLSTGFIVLEHDLFQQSVEIATGYILPDALARTPKLTLEPVITCLGEPLANAYIETNDNSTNPPPATVHFSGTVSGSGSNPSATGATGGSQSGGASPMQSLPGFAAFVLLGLISGFAIAL